MGNARLLRGPKAHLLTGHFEHFRRDMLGFLATAAADYGDIVPLRFAHKHAVFVNNPNHVRQFLVTQATSFMKSESYRILSRLIGDGLITSDGKHWQRQRKLTLPAFHRDRVAAYGAEMVTQTERMLRDWSPGEIREIDADILRLALNIVTHSLLKADLSGGSTRLGAVVASARKETDAIWNSLQLFIPGWLPTPANIRLRRAVKLLDETVYRIIADRRRAGIDGQDLLAMLLGARDDQGKGMTDRQVRDEVLTIFLAGHETTAVTLSWALYLLGRSPDADEELGAELSRVLGGRLPSVADIASLPFTQMVIYETLRLYPPATLIGRLALEDCSFGEQVVKRGTTVMASPWVMHRDGRFFESPNDFRPQRWADGLEDRLPQITFFPFGAGPRRCIGAGFAMTEQILVLATIAQRFRFAPAEREDVLPKVAVTLHPDRPIRMRVAERAVAVRR